MFSLCGQHSYSICRHLFLRLSVLFHFTGSFYCAPRKSSHFSRWAYFPSPGPTHHTRFVSCIFVRNCCLVGLLLLCGLSLLYSHLASFRARPPSLCWLSFPLCVHWFTLTAHFESTLWALPTWVCSIMWAFSLVILCTSLCFMGFFSLGELLFFSLFSTFPGIPFPFVGVIIILGILYRRYFLSFLRTFHFSHGLHLYVDMIFLASSG
jgi:hypothetical protein